MKKTLLIAACSLLFFACNMNPSKEARIQKLETEMRQAIDNINSLENRVQTLEGRNKELETKVLALEKR